MATVFGFLVSGAFAGLGLLLFIKARKIAEVTCVGDNPFDILRLFECIFRKEKGSLTMPVYVWTLRIGCLGFICGFFFFVYLVLTSD
jgi:hypothetical protein